MAAGVIDESGGEEFKSPGTVVKRFLKGLSTVTFPRCAVLPSSAHQASKK